MLEDMVVPLCAIFLCFCFFIREKIKFKNFLKRFSIKKRYTLSIYNFQNRIKEKYKNKTYSESKDILKELSKIMLTFESIQSVDCKQFSKKEFTDYTHVLQQIIDQLENIYNQ